VYRVAFAADGRRIASLSQKGGYGWAGDDSVGIWEVDYPGCLPVLRGHAKYIYPVAYSPDGRWLASGSWDHTVRVWDARTGELCRALEVGRARRRVWRWPDRAVEPGLAVLASIVETRRGPVW
jgi:WD40 repeat protein